MLSLESELSGLNCHCNLIAELEEDRASASNSIVLPMVDSIDLGWVIKFTNDGGISISAESDTTVSEIPSLSMHLYSPELADRALSNVSSGKIAPGTST